VTAYEIGTVKEIPNVRTYLSVNGGMSDNLRPMLYGSRYEAIVANRAGQAPDTLATVAGMHCESGDILITDAMLASPEPGDILVTPATGAYGYSMASNYNGAPRPAVVFCKDGVARVVVRRETWDDLVSRDM
jgi:diaminopimelate decarboxylase